MIKKTLAKTEYHFYKVGKKPFISPRTRDTRLKYIAAREDWPVCKNDPENSEHNSFFSDKYQFWTGQGATIRLLRAPEEKEHLDYIQRIYYSGRKALSVFENINYR